MAYRRKDDIIMSILACNKIDENPGGSTSDGALKRKHKRIEVLVTMRNGSDKPTVFIKKQGEELPENTGERLVLTYPGAKDVKELAALAIIELKKYYYTGFKGTFAAFGLPLVVVGDNVNLVSPLLPERNGKYKVRSVKYDGGVNGLRQEIELDYKLSYVS